MVMTTKCQTPDAQFHTHINDKALTVQVDFGRMLFLDKEEAIVLEANVHNALEVVLAKYYVQDDTSANH